MPFSRTILLLKKTDDFLDSHGLKNIMLAPVGAMISTICANLVNQVR